LTLLEVDLKIVLNAIIVTTLDIQWMDVGSCIGNPLVHNIS